MCDPAEDYILDLEELLREIAEEISTGQANLTSIKLRIEKEIY